MVSSGGVGGAGVEDDCVVVVHEGCREGVDAMNGLLDSLGRGDGEVSVFLSLPV